MEIIKSKIFLVKEHQYIYISFSLYPEWLVRATRSKTATERVLCISRAAVGRTPVTEKERKRERRMRNTCEHFERINRRMLHLIICQLFLHGRAVLTGKCSRYVVTHERKIICFLCGDQSSQNVIFISISPVYDTDEKTDNLRSC